MSRVSRSGIGWLLDLICLMGLVRRVRMAGRTAVGVLGLLGLVVSFVFCPTVRLINDLTLGNLQQVTRGVYQIMSLFQRSMLSHYRTASLLILVVSYPTRLSLIPNSPSPDTDEQPAVVEPLTVAWHAVDRSPVETAKAALVVGGGPIGLAIVQVLKARGVQTVAVAEVSDQRREYALTLGATHVFNPLTDDVVAKIRGLTGDAGADISFECSGVQAGFDAAMKAIRVRGTTTIVSLWDKSPAIDAFDVVSYEKHVIGAAICEDGDFEAVIDAIASGMSLPMSLTLSTRAA